MLSLPAGQQQSLAGSATEPSQQLHGILRTFQRRIRPMAAIFLGFVGLVIVFSLLMPKSYTTTIKLIAGNSNPDPGSYHVPGTNSDLPALNALLLSSGIQSPETYVELFQETPVAQQVAEIGRAHV